MEKWHKSCILQYPFCGNLGINWLVSRSVAPYIGPFSYTYIKLICMSFHKSSPTQGKLPLDLMVCEMNGV